MSITMGFVTANDEHLQQIIDGKIEFYDFRSDEEGKYAYIYATELDFYTSELFEKLPESGYEVANILFLADPSTELGDLIDSGVLYDHEAVASMVESFEKTDLYEFAEYMGYPEENEENILNSLYKVLKDVQKMFVYAKEKQLNVIGYVV